VSEKRKFALICAAIAFISIICMLLVPKYSETELTTEKEDDGRMMLSGAEMYSRNEDMSELKVNINTADAIRLVELPGIGEKLAQSIVDYRTEHGNFGSTEELMNIKGIGEGKYKAIEQYICVE